MSDAAWAMQQLRKYELGVDFATCIVECNWGMRWQWGASCELKTFEEALQHVVSIVEMRK